MRARGFGLTGTPPARSRLPATADTRTSSPSSRTRSVVARASPSRLRCAGARRSGGGTHRGVTALHQAIATGDASWLRARHGKAPSAGQRGLVTHAVKSDRPEMLALLLDLGLDPDERERVDGLEEVVYSWGEPLRQCAISGRPAMAEILLKHGANPNTNVYAASSAMYEAYARQDRAMVELLERHGGFVDAGTAGYLGLAERVEAAVRGRSRRPFARRPRVARRHGRRGPPVQRGRQWTTSISFRWRSSTWIGRGAMRGGSGD